MQPRAGPRWPHRRHARARPSAGLRCRRTPCGGAARRGVIGSWSPDGGRDAGRPRGARHGGRGHCCGTARGPDAGRRRLPGALHVRLAAPRLAGAVAPQRRARRRQHRARRLGGPGDRAGDHGRRGELGAHPAGRVRDPPRRRPPGGHGHRRRRHLAPRHRAHARGRVLATGREPVRQRPGHPRAGPGRAGRRDHGARVPAGGVPARAARLFPSPRRRTGCSCRPPARCRSSAPSRRWTSGSRHRCG